MNANDLRQIELIVRKVLSESVHLPELLTDQQVADRFGISPKTLANWRSSGEGPKVTYLGSIPRYKIEHLNEWLILKTR